MYLKEPKGLSGVGGNGETRCKGAVACAIAELMTLETGKRVIPEEVE